MTTAEAARHRMYQSLTTAIGTEEANTLLEYLPPVGWADVATKTQLDHGLQRLDDRIDALDDKLNGRIDALDSKLNGRIDGLEAKLDSFNAQSIARYDVLDAKIESSMNRAMRINTLVTVSVLSVMMAAFTAISSLS